MLAVGSLALLLLVVAESGRGRLFACTALLGAILPLAATIARRKRMRRWTLNVIGGGVLWVGAAVLLLVLAPNGKTDGRVVHAFTPGHTFSRLSLGNLLPEGDQLLLGFSLMPLVDRLLTTTQASELKRLTAPLYRELEGDADFHALGSVMSEPYGELVGQAGMAGHSYVYVPTGADRSQPRATLVFFHGSGGNFKAYLWILSKLADRLGFILVAPGDGLGNWTEDDSRAGLENAIAAASQAATVDRARIHILGLSNGGLAISRLVTRQGSEFASIIFLSPVFDTTEIRSNSFAAQCRGRRVLVVTGSNDDRIPLSYVEENAARIKRTGAQVTLKTFDGADHFLIFSHRAKLLQVLEEWLRTGVEPHGL